MSAGVIAGIVIGALAAAGPLISACLPLLMPCETLQFLVDSLKSYELLLPPLSLKVLLSLVLRCGCGAVGLLNRTYSLELAWTTPGPQLLPPRLESPASSLSSQLGPQD